MQSNCSLLFFSLALRCVPVVVLCVAVVYRGRCVEMVGLSGADADEAATSPQVNGTRRIVSQRVARVCAHADAMIAWVAQGCVIP